jgi:hypothetical protein
MGILSSRSMSGIAKGEVEVFGPRANFQNCCV